MTTIMLVSFQGNIKRHDGESANDHVPGVNGEVIYSVEPPLKTPFRSKSGTVSSASSRSSSSTRSSIFDESSWRAGTPHTPPVPDTPDSKNVAQSRRPTGGGLSRRSFVDRCVGVNDAQTTAHASLPASSEKWSSRDLSYLDSDYNRVVDGVKNLDVRNDEQSFHTRRSLSRLNLDESPTHPKRTKSQNCNGLSMEVNEAGFRSRSKNGPLIHGHDVERNEETKTAEQVTQHSGHQSSVRRSSRIRDRNMVKDKPHALGQSGDKSQAEGAIACADAQDQPSHGHQHQQTAALAAPQSSQRHPLSGPNFYPQADITTKDTVIDLTSSESGPSMQMNEGEATVPQPQVPIDRGPQSQSHGTSLSVPTVHSSNGSSKPRDDEEPPEAFPNEPTNDPESNPQRLSGTPERMLASSSNKVPNTSILEDMYPIKKTQNDLKNEILLRIRRQRAKPAAASTLQYGYVYIFKSDQYKGCVKIGSTVNAPDIRRSQWSTKCKFVAIHVADENDRAFKFYKIAEQIIHAELYNERKKFSCYKCGSLHEYELEEENGKGEQQQTGQPRQHGEWFEISETEAVKVVNKWRDWVIHQQPYKDDGTLRHCWIWKYEIGTKTMRGTEAEWKVWREFKWPDGFQFILYDVDKWLGGILPPLQTIMIVPGSTSVLLACVYLGVSGVNFMSILMVVGFYLLYRSMHSYYC